MLCLCGFELYSRWVPLIIWLNRNVPGLMISPENCLSSHEIHCLNLNIYVLIYWFESLSWGVEFSDSYPYSDFVVKKKLFNVLPSSASKDGAKSEKFAVGECRKTKFLLLLGSSPFHLQILTCNRNTFIYLNIAAIRKLICILINSI